MGHRPEGRSVTAHQSAILMPPALIPQAKSVVCQSGRAAAILSGRGGKKTDMAYVDIAGGRLHYLRQGIGTGVLLVHGAGSSSRMWCALMDQLDTRFTVYAFDLRGYGRSPARDGWSLDGATADLVHAVEKLELSALHVVGVSAGAQIAVMVQARCPERVRSLVLCGGLIAGNRALRDEVAKVREAMKSLSEDDFAQRTAAGLLMAGAPPGVVETLAADIRTVSGAGYLAALDSFSTTDVSALPAAVEVLALVLAGASDRLVGLADSEALADAFRQAWHRVIPDAGHLAPLDNGAAFNEAVSQFLTAQPG
jgi:pimeloyl-ACP methyl ester carboxylesterase